MSDKITEKQAMQLLKASLDFNTNVMAVATLVVAAQQDKLYLSTTLKSVKLKYIQRNIEDMTREHIRIIKEIVEGDDVQQND